MRRVARTLAVTAGVPAIAAALAFASPLRGQAIVLLASPLLIDGVPRDPGAPFVEVAGSDGALEFDASGDGLDDVWQQRFGAFRLGADEDTDRDGVSNRGESVAGTDPGDPYSRLRIEAADLDRLPLENRIVFTFEGVAGKAYAIEGSSDGGKTWTRICLHCGTRRRTTISSVTSSRRGTSTATGPTTSWSAP